MTVYCIPKAPHHYGDLWVKVSKRGMVTVMNPAGKWWRNRTFTLAEFRNIFKEDMNNQVTQKDNIHDR